MLSGGCVCDHRRMCASLSKTEPKERRKTKLGRTEELFSWRKKDVERYGEICAG